MGKSKKHEKNSRVLAEKDIKAAGIDNIKIKNGEKEEFLDGGGI